ncbi:MAG: hypothetical protein E6Q88_11745 [Lysobacteraceae bacterium]|nr:MAG: hypothetical protein E6Q88_11745 [Xanthomonadaceae bacterium]
MTMFPGVSQSQAVEAFAAGQTISSIVDQVRDSANEVVHNAGLEFGNGAFAARQNAEILIQQLNLMATELEGKTFRDLNATQKAFFINIHNTLDEMKETSSYTVRQAKQLVALSDSMLGTLPGADRTARVVDFSPRYVLADQGARSISITIIGSWIGSGEPAMSLGDKACKRLQKTESRLMFDCIMPAGGTANRVEYNKLVLMTTDRQGVWGRLSSWFGSEPVKRTYELGLAVVPRTLGSFTVAADVSSEKMTEESHVETRRADNQHCWGTRTYAWDVNARSGWQIKDKPHTRLIGDTTATDEGVQAWSQTGFRFMGKAKNNGECIRVFGKVIARDGRGHVEIEARWVEQKPETIKTRVDVPIGEIQWGVERSIPLPEGTAFVSVSSSLIDGTRYEDTSVDAPIRPWYSVSIDIENRHLIVRPRDLEYALARN